MSKQRPIPPSSDSSKLTFMIFQLEGDNTTLQEVLRPILCDRIDGKSRVFFVRLIPAGGRRKKNGRPGSPVAVKLMGCR